MATPAVVLREMLAIPVSIDDNERTVVKCAVERVLDERPDDHTAAAMTAYAASLGAAIALRTAFETGSVPAGTDLGPLCELVRTVRLDYLELIDENYADDEDEHFGYVDALRVVAGCESLLARFGTREET